MAVSEGCEESVDSQESSSCSFFVDSPIAHLCRVCWDNGEPQEMVSPCSCKGTQKYVHIKCLRKWQENVQKRNLRDERAYRCGVCRTHYSLPPPDPLWASRAGQLLRTLGGVACAVVLSLGLAGPPWPHLALFALVLLGTRSQGLLAMALLAAGTMLAIVHAKGLRVLVRVDQTGRLGMALVRHGAPVPGLGPGTLLVASDDLEASIFRRSVVLITEHSRSGARGVILTQPLARSPWVAAGDGNGTDNGTATTQVEENTAQGDGSRREAVAAAAEGAAGAGRVQHRLGGPVGMPGEGVRQEIAVLHLVSGVQGATAVLAAATGAAGEEHQQGQLVQEGLQQRVLYHGGRLSEVLERSQGAPAVAEESKRGWRRREKEREKEMEKKDSEGGSKVLVFHGVSTWAEGQLEGEIRARSWAYGTAQIDDVLTVPPEELWGALAGSARMQWMM